MNLQRCFVLLPGSLCILTIFVNLCRASIVSTNASLYISPESAVAEVGSSVVFNCSVNGLLPPKASIKWYKDWCKEGSDALAKNNTKLLAGGTLQLVLPEVQLADSQPGYYTCCVVLEDGRCDHKVETHVRLRVGFPPEPVRDLICLAHSTYFGHCLWNDSRRDSNLEPSYILQRRFHNKKNWTAVTCIETARPPSDQMADHRCSFAGDDKTYVYRVVSVNSLGENITKPSAALNVHHDAFPYDPPNVMKVTPLGTSSVQVRWDSVEGFSKMDTKYRLRYNTNFNADWILFPKEIRGAMRPKPGALLDDLHPPYANICVQVSAREINQFPYTWGLWSESQCSRLLEDIPLVGPKIHIPQPEENMEDVTNLKDISLSWEHIPEIKRNGKILGYNITVIGSLDTLYENKQTYYMSENATEYQLIGLNRTYKYDVQLTANNSMGISPVTNVTILPDPYPLENTGLTRGSFISILVMLILTAFVLLSFILYCSWKKVKKETFPDPKIPDIVMQSNAYKKSDFMKFHTSEPEHFDAVNLEYDPLLVSHVFSDEQTTAQTAAAIILAGAGLTQQYHTRSIGSGGSYWSSKEDDRTKDNDDGIIYKRMTPQGLSPIDKYSPRHQWDDNVIGEPTRNNDDDGIIYKRMTPQGLSPLYKDSPRNQWDIINIINESTDTSIDTYAKQSAASGTPSTASNSRTSSLRRTANHSRSSSQDITGHYLPVSMPSSSSSAAGSQESGINNYSQQSRTTPFSPKSSDETTLRQMTPQGLSPIDNKCPGNLWNRLVETTNAGSRTDSERDTDSCDDSIGSYTKQSAINHSCNSSATSSPYQSNNSSPIKTRRKTHLDDLCIDDAIKSIQSNDKLPEASDIQTSDVANYVKAGTNSNELRANSSETSLDMRASSTNDVSNYVQSAVQGRNINITENPLTTAHSEGQLHINNYVTCAQNLSMKNRQGSVDSNDSLNVPLCSSGENRNGLENRDSMSSSCSSMEAPYVVHGSANGAELCADNFLVSNGANNTVVLDIEPSPKNSPESPQKSISEIQSTVSNASNNESGYISHPGCTIIANNNHQKPAVDIDVTNSSLPASNEHLFPDAKTPQALPYVTKDFNSNLVPTNSLPKLPCNDGYTPVSAVMQACKQLSMPSLITPEAPYIQLPISLPIPLPSPLPSGSDDGYSSHGNNSPPDTPNILTDDNNVQEDKLTIVCGQSQPTQGLSDGYASFSVV